MNQLATQCNEAEVDIKVHEEVLGKNPSPLAGIHLTTFQSPFGGSTHWAMGDSYSEQNVALFQYFVPQALSVNSIRWRAWTKWPEIHCPRVIMSPRDKAKKEVNLG